MLADLESLEKRVVNLEKRAKGGDKESATTLRLVQPGAGGAERRAARRAPSPCPPTTTRPGACCSC